MVGCLDLARVALQQCVTGTAVLDHWECLAGASDMRCSVFRQ